MIKTKALNAGRHGELLSMSAADFEDVMIVILQNVSQLPLGEHCFQYVAEEKWCSAMYYATKHSVQFAKWLKENCMVSLKKVISGSPTYRANCIKNLLQLDNTDRLVQLINTESCSLKLEYIIADTDVTDVAKALYNGQAVHDVFTEPIFREYLMARGLTVKPEHIKLPGRIINAFMPLLGNTPDAIYRDGGLSDFLSNLDDPGKLVAEQLGPLYHLEIKTMQASRAKPNSCLSLGQMRRIRDGVSECGGKMSCGAESDFFRYLGDCFKLWSSGKIDPDFVGTKVSVKRSEAPVPPETKPRRTKVKRVEAMRSVCLNPENTAVSIFDESGEVIVNTVAISSRVSLGWLNDFGSQLVAQRFNLWPYNKGVKSIFSVVIPQENREFDKNYKCGVAVTFEIVVPPEKDGAITKSICDKLVEIGGDVVPDFRRLWKQYSGVGQKMPSNLEAGEAGLETKDEDIVSFKASDSVKKFSWLHFNELRGRDVRDTAANDGNTPATD